MIHASLNPKYRFILLKHFTILITYYCQKRNFLGVKHVNIIVYCGASEGHNGIYKEGAIQLGQWIAEQNHTLIFGGGNAGLMGAIANSVIQHGGKTIGVMPTFLQQRELAHNGLDELIIVNSMSERKEKILSLGDVCIALPGGPGTLEEISEVVSWSRMDKTKTLVFL